MGDTVELRAGLATTVGPLPFADPEEAVSFALAALPDLPAVPTAGTGARSLLGQAVAGLVGVEVLDHGLLEVAPAAFDAAEAAGAPATVSSAAFAALHEMLGRLPAHSDAHGGFVGVRATLTGPVTLSLALRAAGIPLTTATEVARSVVTRRSANLLGAIRAALPEHLAIVCLHEPGLVGAMHPTFPLAPTDVVDLLDPVVTALDTHPRAGKLLIGAHIPGRTDWETIIASRVSLVSTVADSQVTGWAAVLADFLDRGGRVAWGAVPVDQPLGSSEELLWRRLSGLWCELVAEGLDPLALRRQSLVSTVDGLGHFGPTQAELALGLVRSLSVRVGRQALAARLSLGA